MASLFSGLLYAAWIGLSDRGVLYGRFSIMTFKQSSFSIWVLKTRSSRQGPFTFEAGFGHSISASIGSPTLG